MFTFTTIIRYKMTSRFRSPSVVKDTPRAATFTKDHIHRESEVYSGLSCKNGGYDNRYHFGMPKHEPKIERNGREYGKEETERENSDLLHRKSKQDYGSWNIKNAVQEDDNARKTMRQDDRFNDTRLTNGKFKNESVEIKIDKLQQSYDRNLEYRDEGYVGSLPTEERQRSESIEPQVNGSRISREKKKSWEEDVVSKKGGKLSKVERNNDNNKDDTVQHIDERDVLLKEIENLATDDSQSPDRRIQAMIERLKLREENKLRLKRGQRSTSPEKESYGRRKSIGKSDMRSIADHSHDNQSNDRGRKLKDDYEDNRQLSGSKNPIGKSDQEEDVNQHKFSMDGRSSGIERQNESTFFNKDHEFRKDDSFQKRNDIYSVERNHRKKSREDDENQTRSRDSSKRRSYSSPEDFDVKIQRYDRAPLESRRDHDSLKRNCNLKRKESLKEYDRESVTRKNSFKSGSRRASSKDRESSPSRKTSFKDEQSDGYKKYVSKTQTETGVRYFDKEQETDVSCVNSLKDSKAQISKKTQDEEYGRIYPRNCNSDTEGKVSVKESAAGVSRIILKNFDDNSNRGNSYKNTDEDFRRKSSFKEKIAEFNDSSYKDPENSANRKALLNEDNEEFRQAFFQDHTRDIDRKTANDRYIEFGRISFNTQDDKLHVREKDNEQAVRTNSFKERDPSTKRRVSLRSRAREAHEKRSDRHSRPLTPPKKDRTEFREDATKDSKNFCTKSWHESNRMFSAKYLRDNSKLPSTSNGRLDVHFSPEREFTIVQDTRTAIEAPMNDPDNRFETRGRIDSGNNNSESRFSTRERNGTTIIRIQSSEDPGGTERRRRRRAAQEISAMRYRRYETEDNDEDSDEDEEKSHWRRTRRDDRIVLRRGGNDNGDGGGGNATPSRTIWNYREGVWHFNESIAFNQSFMVQRREAVFINRWRR